MCMVLSRDYINEEINKIRQKKVGWGQLLQVLQSLVKTWVCTPKATGSLRNVFSGGLMWPHQGFKDHSRGTAGNELKRAKSESRGTLELSRRCSD